MSQCTCVIVAAAYNLCDVLVHPIVKVGSSVTPSSLTLSRNGTTVPTTSIAACCRNLFKLDIGAKQYCFSLSRVEKQKLEVEKLEGLKDQRATSLTHSDMAMKVTLAPDRTAM